MAETRFQPVIRLRVCNPEGTPDDSFGPGTARLLQGIREFSSLNRAAAQMGMAYSKAWKSIRATEAHLGFPLIERLGPRGSVLTAAGEAFLNRYLRAEAAAQAAARAVLDETE